MILVVFYICYLPFTIRDTVQAYFLYVNSNYDIEAFNTALTVANFLIHTNSCMNPIIYSKIHERIFKLVKQFIIACLRKCACIMPFNCCNRTLSATAPPNDPSISLDDLSSQRANRQNDIDDHITSHRGPENESNLPRIHREQSCGKTEIEIEIKHCQQQQSNAHKYVQETAF